MTNPRAFADQVRINRVRAALWERPNGASVMVGSGFSRNAEAKLAGRSRLPDWDGLARAMHRELHPEAVCNDAVDALRSVDPLAVAQEYCDEFGRAELHRFLREQIRDDEIEPGECHMRLLKLPWSDVFTTNWDTLLERTAPRVATPSYGVVRATVEIPLVPRPRIVKLNGSLPANFPLVATTRDFDKYPKESAAFVNTAQQAMMETVFLLLGFSANDPNFRRWSKWVRDELGDSAPKIYLAGWLSMDEDRRREFESAHIMPIDLARHPEQAYWRAHQREHEFALEWILTSLEAGQPYPVEEWPKAQSQPVDVPRHLKPVEVTAWDAPKAPVALAGGEEDNGPRDASIEDVVATWEHNRQLYPGWLALPERTRRELLNDWMDDAAGDLLQTAKENELLEAIGGQPLGSRLRAVHEVVWRREIRLEPMGAALAKAAANLLNEVRRGADKDMNVDRALATRVALAVVTAKRIEFDMAGFQTALAVAADFGQYDTEANHRVNHEKCLMALYETDREALRKALDGWQVGAGDPFWGVRKSALMFEGDQNSEDALGLLEESLEQLRGSQEGTTEIPALSREAWASYLSKTLESQSWSGGSGSRAYRRRARDLARFNCDPDSEIGALLSAIEHRAETDEDRGPEFDLGAETRTLRIGSADIPSPEEQRARTAYRVLRLTEVAGLACLADRWPPTKHMLGKASEAFYRNGQVELALRVLLRVAQGSSDHLVNRLLSRPNVASLPDGVVESMVAACERTTTYHKERGFDRPAAKGVVAARERVGVAMECLSRLVLRLDAASVRRVMRCALGCYETRAFYEETLLRSEIRHLLTRSWESLSKEDRGSFVLDMLTASIVGLDGFSPDPYLFVDAGELIDWQDVRLAGRDENNEANWASTVQFLVKGLSGDEETRWRAVLRLFHVAMSDRLRPKEKDMVAAAVWQGHDGTDGPAGEEKLRPWVFFCMPQPEEGTALGWFRRKWMSGGDSSLDGDDSSLDGNGSWLDQALYAIGDMKEQSATRELGFDLLSDDKALVVKLLDRWSETAASPFMFIDLGGRQRAAANKAVSGIATLLMYVDVPDSVVSGLVAKCSPLEDVDVSPLPLLVGLSRFRQGLRERTVAEVRGALLADQRKRVGDAASAIQCWLYFAGRGLLEDPPDGLVREIGAIVETRRTVALSSALWVVEWVFAEGQERHQALLRPPVIAGLASLLPLLRYEGERNGEFDVPLLRLRCVGIARALAEAGHREEQVLAWIEQGREDRLPEVRHRISDLTH